MDAYNQATGQATGQKNWELKAFNLLLTIDNLEAILAQHTIKSFCTTPALLKVVHHCVLEISHLVQEIPVGVRASSPHIPWPYLRNLESLVDKQLLTESPSDAWRILNLRVFPGAGSLAPLVKSVGTRRLLSA